MVLHIREDILSQAGLSERDALIEFACRLFDAGKLPLWPAAELAGLSRVEFEGELLRRGLPVHRVTEESLRRDLRSLNEIWGRSC